ncbi:hypothetical protein EON65_13025 [archaeon]|nr:MAG: hypothetical protein EON65_13025 [archaeon]
MQWVDELELRLATYTINTGSTTSPLDSILADLSVPGNALILAVVELFEETLDCAVIYSQLITVTVL